MVTRAIPIALLLAACAAPPQTQTPARRYVVVPARGSLVSKCMDLCTRFAQPGESTTCHEAVIPFALEQSVQVHDAIVCVVSR